MTVAIVQAIVWAICSVALGAVVFCALIRTITIRATIRLEIDGVEGGDLDVELPPTRMGRARAKEIHWS